MVAAFVFDSPGAGLGGAALRRISPEPWFVLVFERPWGLGACSTRAVRVTWLDASGDRGGSSVFEYLFCSINFSMRYSPTGVAGFLTSYLSARYLLLLVPRPRASFILSLGFGVVAVLGNDPLDESLMMTSDACFLFLDGLLLLGVEGITRFFLLEYYSLGSSTPDPDLLALFNAFSGVLSLRPFLI